MDDTANQELIYYEYRVEDTPRYCVVDENWELYDVYPAKWNAGNKVLVFRREANAYLNKPQNAIQYASRTIPPIPADKEAE